MTLMKLITISEKNVQCSITVVLKTDCLGENDKFNLCDNQALHQNTAASHNLKFWLVL